MLSTLASLDDVAAIRAEVSAISWSSTADTLAADAAALEHTGGGKVVDSEADGDGSLEVEIVREDGRLVEVTLDASLNVVGSEADDDGPEGSGDTADERAENGERD